MKLLPLLAFLMTAVLAHAAETFYVGTYTAPGGSQGIYRYELDPATGQVTDKGLAVESTSPSYLAWHPNGKWLYAVNEGGSGGGVSAFTVEADGSLKLINRESSLGKGATHLSLDRAGKHVLVANYGSGNVAALPIAEDGSLKPAAGFMQHSGSGPNEKRQKGPHAHFVTTDAENKHALVCDLGVDRIYTHAFDAQTGALAEGKPAFGSVAPGAGARHLDLSKDGRFVYVINEMGNTITAFSYTAETGELREVQTVPTLPADFTAPSTTAAIHLHPNGKFLYGSNRGHDSLVCYAVDGATGTLKLVGHTPTQGKTPRFFGIHPSGQWLLAANQESGTVVVFKVDSATGALTPTGQTLTVAKPSCVAWQPAR